MSVASFLPKLWAAGLEVPFKNALVFAQPDIASTKFQPMLQQGARSVEINVIGSPKIKKHDRTQNLVYDELDTTSIELVMDQEDYYAFDVPDIDKVQAAGDFATVGLDMHGIAMAETVDSYIGKVIQAEAGKKIGSTAVFDGADFYTPTDGQITAWDTLRKIVKELNMVSAPSVNRWCVVGANFADALLADKHITEADKAGTDAVARNGLIATLKTIGLSIFVSNAVPTVAEREVISAGVPGSLAFATQLYKVEAGRKETKFADYFRGLQVYGAKVINPKGLVTLEAAVAPGVLPGGATTPAA